jgi:hypothetical protein
VNASFVQEGSEYLTHPCVFAISYWTALTEKTILYAENFVVRY